MSESFVAELRRQRSQARRMLTEALGRGDDWMADAMRSRLEELTHLAVSSGVRPAPVP